MTVIESKDCLYYQTQVVVQWSPCLWTPRDSLVVIMSSVAHTAFDCLACWLYTCGRSRNTLSCQRLCPSTKYGLIDSWVFWQHLNWQVVSAPRRSLSLKHFCLVSILLGHTAPFFLLPEIDKVIDNLKISKFVGPLEDSLKGGVQVVFAL